MGGPKVRMSRRVLGVLSAALGIVGIWVLVFLSFLPGMFLIIFGVVAFLASMGVIGRESDHTLSFWALDRDGKGKWEDVDRIIRR